MTTVSVLHVSKSFDQTVGLTAHTVLAVDDVTLTIASGSVLAILMGVGAQLHGLQRHRPGQMEMLSQVHPTHPPLTQQPLDPIATLQQSYGRKYQGPPFQGVAGCLPPGKVGDGV